MAPCPLCMEYEFPQVETLLGQLISLPVRRLTCPLCSEIIKGVNELTSHLCCHVLNSNPYDYRVNDQNDMERVDNGLQNIRVDGEIENSLSLKKTSATHILHVDIDDCSVPVTIIPETREDGPLQNTATADSHTVPLTADSITQKMSETISCLKCPLNFPNRYLLSMHDELVHCNASIPAKHTSKATHTCNICQKSFKLKATLNIHQRASHNVPADEKVKTDDTCAENQICNVCDKIFKKKHHLTEHFKTHEEKQWKCDICNKLFRTKYFLQNHKRLHTGEMPYTCEVCNKSFTFQQTYHKHLLYHNDLKPYPCNECGRSFKELTTLHNHQRIHTGERPFSCDICGKRFRQRVSYLVHSRIHTGIKPYRCTACKKSFRYKVSERSHKCKATQPMQMIKEGLVNHLASDGIQETQYSTWISANLLAGRNESYQATVTKNISEEIPFTFQEHDKLSNCSEDFVSFVLPSVDAVTAEGEYPEIPDSGNFVNSNFNFNISNSICNTLSNLSMESTDLLFSV